MIQCSVNTVYGYTNVYFILGQISEKKNDFVFLIHHDAPLALPRPQGLLAFFIIFILYMIIHFRIMYDCTTPDDGMREGFITVGQ